MVSKLFVFMVCLLQKKQKHQILFYKVNLTKSVVFFMCSIVSLDQALPLKVPPNSAAGIKDSFFCDLVFSCEPGQKLHGLHSPGMRLVSCAI